MDIAIIGAGPAGIVSATALCNGLHDKCLNLDVFDAGEMYHGRSFNTHSPYMLLNTSVGVTFIDPNKPDELLDYAKRHYEPTTGSGDVIPRDVVVTFLRAAFEKARGRAKKVRFVGRVVLDVMKSDDGRTMVVDSNGSNAYDAVVIATGLKFKALPDGPNYGRVISPYPARWLETIDRGAPLLIVGSRLSAVDVLTHLVGKGHTGRIDIHSRSQLFPCVRHHLIKAQPQKFLARYIDASKALPMDYSRVTCLLGLFEEYLAEQGCSLSDFIVGQGRSGVDQLHHEVQLCRNNQNVWEPIAMDVMDALNGLLPRLDNASKLLFEVEVNPWLGRIMHAMPLRNAEVVERLFKKRQLRMLSVDEFLTADKVRYGAVINATGLQHAESDPLLSRLAVNGLLQFNGIGGVSLDPDTYRLTKQVPIYGNGSISRGEVFTSNSIYSSSSGAQKIVQDIRKYLR